MPYSDLGRIHKKASKIIKIHENWKIALILLACCQYPCGYDPNLNMANCFVYCIDSYPTLRFMTYPQGKKWADMGSYTTECIPKQTKKAIIAQKFNSTSLILIIFILNVIKVSRMQSTEWNWNRKLFLENGVVNGRRFFKMRKLYRAQVTTYCSDRKIQELCHSFELYCCSE